MQNVKKWPLSHVFKIASRLYYLVFFSTFFYIKQMKDGCGFAAFEILSFFEYWVFFLAVFCEEPLERVYSLVFGMILAILKLSPKLRQFSFIF